VVDLSDICIERRSSQLGEDEKLDHQNWAPGKTLDDIERNVILEALQYHQGNRTHTARALGISIRTLRNKLSDYRAMGIRV
jgi:DNA-binding NtrC family response regulator